MRLGLVLIVLALSDIALAQHEGVAATVHNLSSSGPGEVKALDESRICRFCHIPHNAVVPEPLWSHALSSIERYSVPKIRRSAGGGSPAPQPDGSSRLCLSCHDGTVALGDIGQGIAMAAETMPAGRRGFLGTDLSGGHPISFVVPDGNPAHADPGSDMALRPLDVIRSQEGIALDAAGKMQCTTCHDPHSDRYYEPDRVPHFWVGATVDEVCLACHALR